MILATATPCCQQRTSLTPKTMDPPAFCATVALAFLVGALWGALGMRWWANRQTVEVDPLDTISEADIEWLNSDHGE